MNGSLMMASGGITIEDNADDLFAEQADRIAAWNKALGK